MENAGLAPAAVERLDLQFGHGGEAVENAPTPPSRPSGTALHRGHGGEAVENGRRCGPASDVPSSRFNSATAVKPWRTAGGRGDVRRPARGVFNSATAAEPWRTRPPAIPDGERLRLFDSATAVEPWRTSSAQIRLTGGPALQFGHGGGAVENPKAPKPASVHSVPSSIRPRRWSRGELYPPNGDV